MMKNAWGGEKIAKFDGAEISFSDDGEGISDEIADFLFDPFSQLKNQPVVLVLGLYNSKLFIEDHKGEIGFTSTPGKGTTFYLFIPIADSEEKPQTRNKTAKERVRRFQKEETRYPSKLRISESSIWVLD